MHALVADDAGTTRRLIADMLRELGFQVTEAADGRAALHELQSRERPQLLVLDWHMPVVDGLECLVRVRGDRRFDPVRILMVTTETELSQVAKAIAAGADEYLMKPFSKAMVEEKLKLLGLGHG